MADNRSLAAELEQTQIAWSGPDCPVVVLPSVRRASIIVKRGWTSIAQSTQPAVVDCASLSTLQLRSLSLTDLARTVPPDQCLEIREPRTGDQRRGVGAHLGPPSDQAENRRERDRYAGEAAAELIPVQKLARDAQGLDEGPPLGPLGPGRRG